MKHTRTQVNVVNPGHLYEQIVEDLRGKILRGELKPGEQIATQTELARKYRVSLITVKNAISNLVKERLLVARAGKGTFVLEGKSQGVDFSKHRTLGLVLRDLKHPYFSMIIHSIEERASELGYYTLLSSSSGNREKEERQIKKFRQLGVDGLIIASLSLEYKATDYIQRLHQEGFPYVMVSYIHDPAFWYVGSDQELGGYMATEHLIHLGYRSIGYVHPGRNNLLSEIRKNGYVRALMDFNIPFNADAVLTMETPRHLTGTDRYQLGYHFSRTFRDLSSRPEALSFYNDLSALGFIEGIKELGIRVPGDVAVVGFDDITVAQFASVPLTTIRQPVDKIGRMAVDVIQRKIDGVDTGNRTVLRPSLIIRESCGAKDRGYVAATDTRIEHLSI